LILRAAMSRQNQSDSATAPLFPAQRRYFYFTAAMTGGTIMIIAISGVRFCE
jgi:hypothetical protein